MALSRAPSQPRKEWASQIHLHLPAKPTSCKAFTHAMSPGKHVTLFSCSLLGVTRGLEGVFKGLWDIEKRFLWILMEKTFLIIKPQKKKKKKKSDSLFRPDMF